MIESRQDSKKSGDIVYHLARLPAEFVAPALRARTSRQFDRLTASSDVCRLKKTSRPRRKFTIGKAVSF